MCSTNDERIIVNVSGSIFETWRSTLDRFPETLLGNKHYCNRYYSIKSKEYFFDRNQKAFEAILYFYQSHGDLRIPPDVQMDFFIRDCKFFGIPKESIDAMKFKAGMTNTIDEHTKTKKKHVDMFCSDFQRKAWDLLENPESSELARTLAIISIILILMSVILACTETVPSIKGLNLPFWQNPMAVIEFSLNTCFLVEVVARFVFCPNKFRFLQSFLNIIDIIGVIPYFIVFVISKDKMTSLSFLRILRFFRVLRLFRLSKHSARIKTVGIILKDSIKDLYVFAVCLFIMTVFSGTILYFAEKSDENTKFTSIPESMWWALQTVVTVGYGDITPMTLFGKFYSAFFMVFGALTIALPVLSIVMKFTIMYSVQPGQ
ncbi:potassium voltage-gated channel subfamily A member 1-like [Clytia hemisphaerica]|uniref:potassium voltage-gated channel subfamily A member 1-like n=1 Tax=Clytia hemisphaerica TaxID=252671 RepID=UPI0034D43A83